MPRLPMDPSLRARRNRTPGAATLTLAPGVTVPELPVRLGDEGAPVDWHPRTTAWWTRVWASPMAAEWLDADVPGLELVAELWDDFYKSTSPSLRVKVSAELRLQERRFGLAPMDRRSLQWEVERAEDARDRGSRRRWAADADADALTDPPTAPADARLALVEDARTSS